MLDRLRPLFAPVDIASLVFFRISFGAIMLWEVYRHFSKGWVAAHYVEPAFHFSYPGFGWVQPWPGDGMFVHFYVMAALAVCVMLGLAYRQSAALFFLAFTYVFLLDSATYLNHYYFAALVSLLMVFVPAHRAFSVDAWLRKPSWRSDQVPAWSLWILRAQMGFVYFFAGVAKLNGDWLRGYPMAVWMQDKDLPAVLAPLLAQAWVAVSMSWAGLLFDLLIVPALLWRRSRPFALVAAVLFHAMNAHLFRIGIFPWFSIAATLLFLDPDWPRRIFRRLRPVADAQPAPAPVVFGPRQKWIGALLVVYVAVQVALPLRPHFYAGNTSWTEEGHRFSWRQMLSTKAGKIEYVVKHPTTGRSFRVDPRRHLIRPQFNFMRSPGLVLEFAHHLADESESAGLPRAEVYALALVSLNGREPQVAIDATVDLAAEPRRLLTPYPWILPLEVPLEAQRDGESHAKHPATVAALERIRSRAQAKFAARSNR